MVRTCNSCDWTPRFSAGLWSGITIPVIGPHVLRPACGQSLQFLLLDPTALRQPVVRTCNSCYWTPQPHAGLWSRITPPAFGPHPALKAENRKQKTESREKEKRRDCEKGQKDAGAHFCGMSLQRRTLCRENRGKIRRKSSFFGQFDSFPETTCQKKRNLLYWLMDWGQTG